jgi:hypothetical protein
MTETQKIALALFLMDKSNRKAVEQSIRQLNNFLASLNPDLTIEQKFELLTK